MTGPQPIVGHGDRREPRYYPGFLLIVAAVYGAYSLSWLNGGTPGRVDGIQWVAGWMTPNLVALMWALGAAVCAAAGVAVAVRRSPSRRAVMVAGVVSVALPLLLGLIFFGSWVVYLLDDPTFPPPAAPEKRTWHDAGSPTGWVTATSYWAIAAVAWWELSIETGVLRLLLKTFGRSGERLRDE